MLIARNLAYYGDYSLECKNCNRSLEPGKSWDLWDPEERKWYQTVGCRRCIEKIGARLNRKGYKIP